MVNGSFVFGMDGDDPDVFARTVEWAVRAGVETATFHVLTPYPGTALFRQLDTEERLLHRDWELYDTRHAVFEPRGMTAAQLETGYWRAYRDFYSWGAIVRAAAAQPTLAGSMRHAAYAVGWKKLEPLWDALIRSGLVGRARPLLERVLDAAQPQRRPRPAAPPAMRAPASLSSHASGPRRLMPNTRSAPPPAADSSRPSPPLRRASVTTVSPPVPTVLPRLVSIEPTPRSHGVLPRVREVRARRVPRV